MSVISAAESSSTSTCLPLMLAGIDIRDPAISRSGSAFDGTDDETSSAANAARTRKPRENISTPLLAQEG
jgi:hypothetical protein